MSAFGIYGGSEMKTRIVWTKIWEDEWFATLSDPAQKLFIYLLTNSRANMCGCYQLSDRVIIFDTRIVDLETAKKELNPKAKFKSGWVYLPNAKYYGGYSGKKNEVTIKKEEAQIDKNIKLALFTTQQDRVSIGYPQVETTTDTTINQPPRGRAGGVWKET